MDLSEEKQRQIALWAMFGALYREKDYKNIKALLDDKSKNNFDCINYVDSFDLGAPVHWAVYDNDLKMLSFLHKNGADLNCQTYASKYTPLMLAVLDNQKNIIRFLLNKGVDTELKNANGLTAFQMLDKDIQSGKELLTRHKNNLKEKIQIQRFIQSRERS